MTGPIRSIVIGIIAVLLFDTLTAVISSSTGLRYEWFSIGSAIIAILFGFLVARQSRWFVGGLAGALLGFADSTVGWMISWTIGPGRPEPEMSIAEIFFVIIFVTVETAVLGLVGGALSLVKRTNA